MYIGRYAAVGLWQRLILFTFQISLRHFCDSLSACFISLGFFSGAACAKKQLINVLKSTSGFKI